MQMVTSKNIGVCIIICRIMEDRDGEYRVERNKCSEVDGIAISII